MTHFVIEMILLGLLIMAMVAPPAIAARRTRRLAAAKRRAIAHQQAQSEARAMQMVHDAVTDMFRAAREQQK